MLYEVRRNRKSGYINGKGEVIVPIEADHCLEFTDLGGVFREQNLEIVDHNGKVIGSCDGVITGLRFSEGRLDAVDKSNRAKNSELPLGYLDEKGNWVIQPKFRHGEEFHDGLAVASVIAKESYAEGLIDFSGNWVFEPKFETILGFTPGMSTTIARQYYGKNDDVRCLLIDKSGQQVGTEYYENARGGGDGLFPVMRNGKFGCVDQQGHLVIPFAFEDMSFFSEGFAPARVDSEKVGVIDKHGHWVIHPKFTFVENFSEGVAAAQVLENGVYKWGYIDPDGHWVIKPKFEEAYDFQHGVANVVPLGVDPAHFQDIVYIDRQGEYIWGPETRVR